MANNRNPKQKQPGEKEPGKYHYNPGNQSGKTVEIIKPEPSQENNADRRQGHQEQKDRER
jgi:hypothetical protein